MRHILEVCEDDGLGTQLLLHLQGEWKRFTHHYVSPL